ncbi:MAG: hypothetical protein EXR46_00450 [Dehalococcoidia bacterium]|nr:hypothetical protein [Dehalococcoidia bacterium]
MGVLLWALRSLISSLLSAVIFLSFLALLIVNSFSNKLLNDDVYSRALASEHAYTRIYDEVLMDPQIRQEIQAALGDTGLISYQDLLRVLREAAPPEYLQAQTERAIESSVDYFAGDADTWTAYIELGPALDQVKPVLFRLVDQRIDLVPLAQPDPSKTPGQQLAGLVQQAEALVDDLANRRVPSAVPSLEALPAQLRGPAFDSFIAGLISDSSLDPRFRQGLQNNRDELRRVFVAGDTRQVAKLAARAALSPVVDDALAQVRSRLDPQARVDLVALVKESEGGGQVWAELQPWIDQARLWMPRLSLLGLLALAGVAGGAFLLGLIHLPRLTKALSRPGFALLAVGASSFFLSKLTQSALLERLDGLVDASAAGLTGVPPSVIDLITDVAGAVARQLTDGFVIPSVALMAVGIALLFAAVVAFLVDRRSLSVD